MSTRHLVDPELAPILDLAPDFSVSADRLDAARAAIAENTLAGLAAADPTVPFTEHFVPGPAGAPDVRVLVYRPEGLPSGAPVVLQVHGGGFLFGNAETGDPRNRAMAKAVGCGVVSVDYRLAPEAPFPAGLEDCYAALTWLSENASPLGFDPARIAVRGESAGGCLAAALALLARDRGGPALCFQLLVYPMLDDRTCTRHPHPVSGEFVWNRGSNDFAWSSWLGQPAGGADVPPLAAPARVEDLAGLPPTMIATAALDLFAEEDLEYAARLLRAGVPIELYVAPGAFHGFDAMVADSAVARRFTALADDALRRAFAPLAKRDKAA